MIRVRPLRPDEQTDLRLPKRHEANAIEGRQARTVPPSGCDVGSHSIARQCDSIPQQVRVIIQRSDEHRLDDITRYPRMCGSGKASRFLVADLELVAELALSSSVPSSA